MSSKESPEAFFSDYALRLQSVLASRDWSSVAQLGKDMLACWQSGRQLFLCGNGGSAANATHLANDFLCGIGGEEKKGMKVQSLAANAAVMTCLGNDLGYERIFSQQLAVQGQAGDLLLVFSGSGNSANIKAALEQAKQMGIKSYAVLGYSGGVCKTLADVPIHFPIDDMQIAEDTQSIVGHMLMQWLYLNRPKQQSQQGASHADAETVCNR